MPRPPKSLPAETPAPVLTDDECRALSHLGPLCLDPEVYAQVRAYTTRMAGSGDGFQRTIPGPLITGP